MVPMPMVFDELAVFHKNLYIELCRSTRNPPMHGTGAWILAAGLPNLMFAKV